MNDVEFRNRIWEYWENREVGSWSIGALKLEVFTAMDAPEDVLDFTGPLDGDWNFGLAIRHHGKVLDVKIDGWEPEDACFVRDLDWVPWWTLIAYQMGQEDAQKKEANAHDPQ